MAKVKKVRVEATLDKTSAYLAGAKRHAKLLKGIRGLVPVRNLQFAVKRVDAYSRRIVRLEKEIASLEGKQNSEAVKLDEQIARNLKIVRGCSSKSEYRDFRGE